MPRPPGIIDRVNYLVNSCNNPCDVPWAVYVETALPAALEAVIAVVCFDIGDVARFIFRPASVRSGRHGSRKRKGQHGRKPKGFRARLAAKLPPFEALQQRKIAQGVRNLWIIDGIGQRLLWWWLVADVTTGFLYNWTSMIQKTEICQMALAPGTALREDVNQTFLAIQNWPDVLFTKLDYEKGVTTAGPASFACGSGDFQIVAAVEVVNGGPLPCDVELRLFLSTPGGTVIEPGGEIGLGLGGSGGVIAFAFQRGPFSGRVEMQVSAGNVQGVAGSLYIQGMPPTMDPPVKFNCDSPFFPP